MVTLLLLSCRCIVTLHVMWLFLTVLWVGVQLVIVVFPEITDLLLNSRNILCVSLDLVQV